MSKTIHFTTFGCQMNKLDSELAMGALRDAGYSSAASQDEADVIIFNTCSVRQHAEDKVYSHLGVLKARKRKNPDLLIGVIGCMAQREGEKIFKRMPHIDLVCGTRMFHRLPELLEKVEQDGKHILAIDENEAVSIKRPESERPNRYQAFVSIMRGCDNFCAYCVVPYVRGREVSRPIHEIVAEARNLVDDGCKEITLIGQNVNSYGKSFDLASQQSPLAKLLEELSVIHGLERLRFVTSHPKDMNEDIVQAMTLPKVCEHLHLPAQAGSDKVLKLMNRRYTASHYRRLADRLREIVPGITLASDFIVGFPGETNNDFHETVSLMKDVRFQNCFIFKYSPRSGTRAAELSDDIPDEAKRERNQILLKLQEEISSEDNQKLIGKTAEVLVEGRSKYDKQKLTGRTRQNHIVVFNGGDEIIGELVDVEIIDSTALTLFGA